MAYFEIRKNVNIMYGIKQTPDYGRISFLGGKHIDMNKLDNPIVVECDYPADAQPSHYLDSEIPLISKLFAKTLLDAGIDNFQLFPALLRNPETGQEWSNYSAFNVVGLVDAADMKASEFDTIMDGDGSVPSLVGFNKLVFDEKKTHGLNMFRLAEDPTVLVLHERVVEYFEAHNPDLNHKFYRAWGVSLFEIKTQ